MALSVLFVDDDPMLLASMRRCLGLQFHLSTALSGPEALELIEQQEPIAVIVSDMRMPGMDGIEFVRRARELTEDSAFVMLTGNQDENTVIRAMSEQHVYRFLNKPCDPAEITEAIHQAHRQHQQLGPASAATSEAAN